MRWGLGFFDIFKFITVITTFAKIFRDVVFNIARKGATKLG